MASFSLPDSSSLQRAAVLKNSICLTARDWDEIATALLEDRLVLTALELYTELLESGKEVQCLKDYFSNPGNFEHVIPQVFSGTGLLQSISELEVNTAPSPTTSSDACTVSYIPCICCL